MTGRCIRTCRGETELGAFMKAVFCALSVGLALMVMGTSASAVPFSYRFDFTVAAGTMGLPASPGDPANITVTLDNGGASDLSQVWTSADLQSLTFDINNGAATISFFSPFDGGLATTHNSFATDAAGNLISVPLGPFGRFGWLDRNVTADFIASFPVNGGLFWHFSTAYNIVLAEANSPLLLLGDPRGILDPANWSRVTALSLPPTVLLLLVGLGGVALLRRGGPGVATKSPFPPAAAPSALVR